MAVAPALTASVRTRDVGEQAPARRANAGSPLHHDGFEIRSALRISNGPLVDPRA
jgi:hypothetical protein